VCFIGSPSNLSNIKINPIGIKFCGRSGMEIRDCRGKEIL
jgi:hypothetical protein